MLLFLLFFNQLAYLRKLNNNNTSSSKKNISTTKGGIALKILESFFTVDKKKTFSGKALQILSRFTWELPQQTLSVLTGEFVNLLGGIENAYFQNGALVLENKFLLPGVGYTLGNILTVGSRSSSSDISHEFGHYIQSRRFGPGYLLGIAIPSVVRAFFWNTSNSTTPYNSFYTEGNATKLGIKYWH